MGSTSKSAARGHRCEYCQKEFVRKSNLNEHRKIHLFKKDFNCSFCKYVTNFKQCLDQHIRSHTKERPYKCGWPNCNAAFKDYANRNRHLNSVHKKDDDSLTKHKCPKCPYKTSHNSNFHSHLKTHSDLKPFACDLCPYRAKQKSGIKVHQESVHLILKPFKCQHPGCNSAFSQKSNLKQHQLVHNKDDDSLWKFKCPECRYKVRRQCDLNRHMTIHSEVKPFSCDLCPFRSKQRHYMKRHHKTVHSTLKPFKCPESSCSYSAKTKSHLTNHMKVHVDYKEFSCSFPPCAYRTKHKSAMKTHEMTHREEKPFKCSFCSYKCTHKSNLCVHIRRHTGETPFPCPSCPFCGKNSKQLNLHMKRLHSRKKSDAGALSRN